MEFFIDTRPKVKLVQGFAFGAVGGAVGGIALAATGVGMSAVLPLTAYFGIEVGLFEWILNSQGADRLRTEDFDPAKYGGAAATSVVAGAVAATMLPGAGVQTALMLAGAGFGSITSYMHVAWFTEFLTGKMPLCAHLGQDIAAIVVTSAINGLAFKKVYGGGFKRGVSRNIAFARGAIFLCVPLSVVSLLERQF